MKAVHVNGLVLTLVRSVSLFSMEYRHNRRQSVRGGSLELIIPEIRISGQGSVFDETRRFNEKHCAYKTTPPQIPCCDNDDKEDFSGIRLAIQHDNSYVIREEDLKKLCSFSHSFGSHGFKLLGSLNSVLYAGGIIAIIGRDGRSLSILKKDSSDQLFGFLERETVGSQRGHWKAFQSKAFQSKKIC